MASDNIFPTPLSTTNADEELSQRVIRRIAELELTSTAQSRVTVLEEHSAAFRWLLASMLVVNGGAIATSVQAGYFRDWLSLLSGSVFVFGVLGALLSAWFSQRANRAMLEPLATITVYWLGVAETGTADEDELKTILEKVETATKKALPTQICGWLSSICFLIGCSLMGTSIALAPMFNVGEPHEKIQTKTVQAR